VQIAYGKGVLAAAVATVLGVPAAYGGPTGGQVVAGQATIHAGSGSTVVNQASQRAVVNWQSFSLSAGERAQFNLPSSSAAILNRVVTNNPSAIYGSLGSNGRVFLINPSGVIVGPSGVIQAAGFVASTRDVSNQQFMAGGALDFKGDSTAAVRNLGAIVALDGDAGLIGARVENAGRMDAPRGTVALVSADHVYYAPESGASIVVRAGVAASQAQTGIDHSGLIDAARAELRAAGGNPLALAVNSSGIVTATRVEHVGDRVILSGTVRGEDIRVLGDEVTLRAGAVLDASGAARGGRILVGGDFQGRNPEVRNARTTLVERGAKLRADALEKGDGGKVIVWADGTTRYEGSISARGGAQGGDGGFAEVSGKERLAFRGTADLRAPMGRTGELLLDPTDLTIGVLGPTTASCAAGTCSGSGASSYLDFLDLQAALNTSSVTVTTSSAGAGAGDITIDASVNAFNLLEAPNNLTLDAERDINVNGTFYLIPSLPTGLGTPTLTLKAGRHITVAPNLNNQNALNQPYGLLGDAGLTLAAGLTDATGTISVGANSNLATMRELSGDSTLGGPIRIFGRNAAQTILTGWTPGSSVPVTGGKQFGDAGTAAAGIYYQDGALTVLDANTTGTGANPLSIVPIGTVPHDPVADHYDAMRKAGGARYDFSPAVDEMLTLTRWFAESTRMPGQTSLDSYAAALLAIMKSLEEKPAGERTAEETMILRDLSAAVYVMMEQGLREDIARERAELRSLEEDLARRQSAYVGMAILFTDDRTLFRLADEIDAKKQSIAKKEAALKSDASRAVALRQYLLVARAAKSKARDSLTLEY
jgi:filamentous hemagglutinin family protein